MLDLAQLVISVLVGKQSSLYEEIVARDEDGNVDAEAMNVLKEYLNKNGGLLTERLRSIRELLDGLA